MTVRSFRPLFPSHDRATVDVFVGILLVAAAMIPVLGYGLAYDRMFALPGNIDQYSDAMTYLAAGERLNAGHLLYALAPGDRPVLIDPEFFRTPLVSPPTIGVLWRPLAATPMGLPVWLLGSWIALLGSIAFLIWRVRLPALVLTLVLAEPIGNQLALGNITAFFPALLIAMWCNRQRPWIGVLASLGTALKLSPVALFAWRGVWQRRGTLSVAIGSLVLVAVLVIAFGGVRSVLDYPASIGTVRPSVLSLSGLTGISWLSQAILLILMIVAIAVPSERWSFVASVVALTVGTPVLFMPGLVPLIAVLAPWASVTEHQASAAPLALPQPA